MRIDKYLKVTRILKRRSVGKEACDGGKVSINGKDVKPSHEVKVGDIVEIRFGQGTMKFKVLVVKEQVRKNEAQEMYEIITEEWYIWKKYM